MKKALVCGGGGFIGGHLVKRLKSEGFRVRAVDLKRPPFAPTAADEFLQGDLRDRGLANEALEGGFDEVYQLAADMGGAGFVFSGDNDADIMHNSASINLNVVEACARHRCGRVFFASSACVYPEHNQLDPSRLTMAEDSAFPAAPDSEYGWEKLFSERIYLAYQRNHGLQVRIGRYHNVFGPEGAWNDGREKAPAAICRKVAIAEDGGEIEIWGDGEQTRSFLYVDEALEGTLRLMRSNWSGPVNIGSEEMVSINGLAETVIRLAGKTLALRHVPGPLGVRCRTSDNTLILERLGWRPSRPLEEGLRVTYAWICEQVARHPELLAEGAQPNAAAASVRRPVASSN